MKSILTLLALTCLVGIEQITCTRGSECREGTPCLVESGMLTAWGSDSSMCGSDPMVRCKFQFRDVRSDEYRSVPADCVSECVENP